MPSFGPGPRDGDEGEDLQVLERLVGDLRRYATGEVPTATELAAAPS